jgi:hypothetical protein
VLLPEVASRVCLIEVVRITDPVRAYDAGRVVGEDLAIWEEEHTRQVLDLVSRLPGSEMHRCFVPGCGIRAHGPAEVPFEIAFCFRCHGALLNGPHVPSQLRGIQTFDPDSPSGRELLDRFRACQETTDAQ